MNRLRRLPASIADSGLAAVAALYNARTGLLDAAGAVCAVVCASLFSERVAWGVAAALFLVAARSAERS